MFSKRTRWTPVRGSDKIAKLKGEAGEKVADFLLRYVEENCERHVLGDAPTMVETQRTLLELRLRASS
eukprot:366472-Chlamydomonas_euryale.AAC.17